MSESDLISPRFLARVERSLLKRMSGDIRPHLQRFAAHAHSKREFITSAARLLVNPRERERWLASWEERLRAREAAAARADAAQPGTVPLDLDLDSTMPAPFDLSPQRGFQLSPAQRQRLYEALAREIGPGSASGLLDSEIQRSETAGELLARLQIHLDSDSQRLRFVNSAITSLDPGA